ncbi:MAG: hypothetical protein JW785_11650 [Acidimicrobiia bacterium]|nr:hypothetical protein [Acidimicrobiia bacterium]
MQQREHASAPTGSGGAVPTDAERLAAALEALAARDQVLADRSRRLAALQDTADRLAAVSARLQAAEEELAALRRAHRAEIAQREERLAELESLRASLPARDGLSVPDAAPQPDLASGAEAIVLARLRRDLEIERRRNFRLGERHSAPAAETARLQEALDAERRRSAELQQRLPAAAAPEEGYAPAEERFRRRLEARGSGELARAEETIRSQRRVLEEKERLISLLLDRCRAAGRLREGPDDLKEVSGIGPVIEDLLHGLGITTFGQLAALTDEELDRIGDRLGAFHERVHRDRWREQAAELERQRVRLGPGLTLR